jgi:hypothetical protein
MTSKFFGTPMTARNRIILRSVAAVLLCCLLTVATLFYCLTHGTISHYVFPIIMVNAIANIAILSISAMLHSNLKRTNALRSTHVR